MGEANIPGKAIKRIAIFGTGKMAMHHIKAISLQRNAQVVAVADPAADEDQLKNVLPKSTLIFRSSEELLRNVHPDVVHICTPPISHYSLAVAALNAGAHIYVEKPFSLNCKDAENIISLANSLNLKVCAGHQLLFEPHMFMVKEQLPKLGKIIYVESYFSFKTVRRSNDGRRTISPLDQLIDILPHPVYLLLYFLKINSMNGNELIVKTGSLEVRTDGNVCGIFNCGDTTGMLVVTLTGRPIECYVRIVGTNGRLYAEFVRGTYTALLGPGSSGISKIINPYSESWQTVFRTSTALYKRFFRKHKCYPGLFEIIKEFYNSLEEGKEAALNERSIIDTVSICEEIGQRLKSADEEENKLAEASLSKIELNMPRRESRGRGVLVTGGTGMLGTAVAKELLNNNWDVRVISRNTQPYKLRIPGVKYIVADLGEGVAPDILSDIALVVHCAAETSGGKEAHERNTVRATKNILDAMETAGVKKLIHISSIAVLKSSRDIKGLVNEKTEITLESEERGPYVWGKAQAEHMVAERSKGLLIDSRIIRPGPLVDDNAFMAPGRLGREVGRLFVCIGSRNDMLSLCSVQTAAEVIRTYVENFDSMPPVLNLIDPKSPSRGELLSRLLNTRPDLKAVRIPTVIIFIISGMAKFLQRLLRPGKKPLDVYAAFASERYESNLADNIIQQSKLKGNLTQKSNLNNITHDT